MNWENRSAEGSRVYSQRYVYMGDPTNGLSGSPGLRVLLLKGDNMWSVRWGGDIQDRHLMPPDTPLEKVQAVAIALWRME